MIATLWRDLILLGSLASLAIACSSSDDDSWLWVQLDGRRFVPTQVSASLFSEGAERSLIVNAVNSGSDDEDDEEWFTLSLRLNPEALVPGALQIDGSAMLVDRVPGESRGYPREEDVTFEAGADHDPRALRAWVGHHAWFSTWDGDQSQTLAGQIAFESVDADSGVRGSLALLVSGQLPPVSWKSDHELRLIGRFQTGPMRERGALTQ